MKPNKGFYRPVIGITGPVGSGKSTVLTILESYGAEIIRTDVLAHRLMEPGAKSYNDIVAEFGSGILDESGRIDRSLLRDQVFSDPDRLKILNAITHPNVISVVRDEIRDFREDETVPLLAIESALFIGSGLEKDLDSLWYIYVNEEERVRRLMESRGYTEEYTRKVLASQPPDEDFRKTADLVIDNSGSRESAEVQIKEILRGYGL